LNPVASRGIDSSGSGLILSKPISETSSSGCGLILSKANSENYSSGSGGGLILSKSNSENCSSSFSMDSMGNNISISEISKETVIGITASPLTTDIWEHIVSQFIAPTHMRTSIIACSLEIVRCYRVPLIGHNVG